jgi:hypothetical protein
MDCLEQGLNDGFLPGGGSQTKSYLATVLDKALHIFVLLLFFFVKLGPKRGRQLFVVKTLLKRFLNESHVVEHVLYADHHVTASPRKQRESTCVFICSSKNWGNVSSQFSMNVSVGSGGISDGAGPHISCCWTRLSML